MRFVNPGNLGFSEIDDEDYVDKTDLIDLVNRTIGKKNKLTCVCRPRRFGKSWTAKMLVAYYDSSCDSHVLFDEKKIAKTADYETFLNKFNVICLDITSFLSDIKSSKEASLVDIAEKIKSAIWKDLLEGGYEPAEDDTLNDFLLRCVQKSNGKKFIFIIDEWDAVIREAKNDSMAQEAYLNLLRGWFKNNNFTSKAVAAAYMTGILPIKKDGSQSAISDFKEYSMLYPGKFAKYTGFTENEVREICEKKGMSFEEVKSWYDGYELQGTMSIYNPYSVMNAIEEGVCRSYWGSTSAAESLTNYIKMDFDGLQETVANLMAGSSVAVHTESFKNDFERFEGTDDILTLLIHLGYLTYDTNNQKALIPNEEVKREFTNFLRGENVGTEWIKLKRRSEKLVKDTVSLNGDAVAATIEEIRMEQYAPQFYNNEQALRSIIKYAYLSLIGKCVKIEEMPSGKGIADIVYIPFAESGLPPMIVELKWNKTSGGAIEQIKDKKYAAVLKPYEGEILLVGIHYDEKTKRHTCRIEKG